MSEATVKIVSEQMASWYMVKKCVSKKGIGSYFCQCECIYNRGTTYGGEHRTFIKVECANPKQVSRP